MHIRFAVLFSPLKTNSLHDQELEPEQNQYEGRVAQDYKHKRNLPKGVFTNQGIFISLPIIFLLFCLLEGGGTENLA